MYAFVSDGEGVELAGSVRREGSKNIIIIIIVIRIDSLLTAKKQTGKTNKSVA